MLNETFYCNKNNLFTALNEWESCKLVDKYKKGYLIKVPIPETNKQGFLYLTRIRKRLVAISKTPLKGYNRLLREVYKYYEW